MAAIPEEDKTLETASENFNSYYNSQKMNSSSNIMNLPSNIQIDENTQPLFNKTTNYEQIKQLPEPSDWPTLTGAIKDISDFHTATDYLHDAAYQNPFNDTAPEGWSPKDEISSLTGLDSKYSGFVLKGNSPQDVRNRYRLMLDRQSEDEEWKNGSSTMKVLGGFIGGAANPTSWFPIARGVRYLSMSENILNNLARTLPSVSAASLSHNAIQQTLKQGGNLENFVVDTAIDTMGGMLFMGAGAGLSAGVNAMHLFNVRGAQKMIYDGIETKIVTKPDGEVTGFKAVPIAGENVGAAKVDQAQAFLDSEFAKKGLFKVPILSGLLGKGAAAMSPLFRGLNSRFETIRGMTNRTQSHSLYTKGIEEGRPAPDSFDDEMKKVQGDNLTLMTQMEGYYLERLGIDIHGNNQVMDFAKEKIAKFQDDYVSEEQHNDDVYHAIITGDTSPHGAVNEPAQLYRKEVDDIFKEWLRVEERDETIHKPKTANKYATVSYNHDAVFTNDAEWNNMFFKNAKEQEAIIHSHMQPIEDYRQSLKKAKQDHEAFVRDKNNTEESKAESARELKARERALRIMKEKVQNKIREDESLDILVHDRNALSAKEANKLKTITKPLRLLAKDLKAKKESLATLNQQIYFNENKVSSKNIEELDRLRAESEKLKNEVNEAQRAHDTEEEKLQDDAVSGKIPKILYDRIPGSQRVKFKKSTNRLKFVDKFESDFHIQEAGKQTRDRILNQTNEETSNEIFNGVMGIKPTNPLKYRSVMIPQETLYRNGFLSKDIGRNLANYRTMFGRKIALKKVFGDLSVDGGLAPLAERLTQEYREQYDQIMKSKLAKGPVKLSDKDTKRINKEKRQLKKDFESAKEFMNLTYNRMMGQNRLSGKQRAFSNISRTFAAMTKLGFVPLTMSTDAMGITFKHGVWPTIRDGLLPLLKTLNANLKTKASEDVKKLAAHSHLANNHLIASYSETNWSGVTEQHVALTGKIESGLEKAAHVSNNFNLISYAENFLQRWTALVVQSKIMGHMIDFEKGSLSKLDHENLLKYGLDPKEWSSKFVKGWKEAGEDGNGFGGYTSRHWEWKDAQAANKMADTIRKATHDTILRKGILDAPFFTDSSVWGSIYSTFHGWAYSSGTRFLLPLLQQGQMNQLMGTLLMFGAGALQDPLYKIMSGEKQVETKEDDHWVFQAITNGGVFSLPASLIQEANMVFGGKLLKGITNQRFKNRTVAGIAAGAPGGQIEDLIKIVSMVGFRNWNEADAKRIVRNSPIISSIYLRGIINHWIEGKGLPKTYGEASKQNE